MSNIAYEDWKPSAQSKLRSAESDLIWARKALAELTKEES